MSYQLTYTVGDVLRDGYRGTVLIKQQQTWPTTAPKSWLLMPHLKEYINNPGTRSSASL
jgi:hypothetical protein